MTQNQVRALCALGVAICGALAVFFPQYSGAFIPIATFLGGLAVNTPGKPKAGPGVLPVALVALIGLGSGCAHIPTEEDAHIPTEEDAYMAQLQMEEAKAEIEAMQADANAIRPFVEAACPGVDMPSMYCLKATGALQAFDRASKTALDALKAGTYTVQQLDAVRNAVQELVDEVRGPDAG